MVTLPTGTVTFLFLRADPSHLPESGPGGRTGKGGVCECTPESGGV